MPPQRCGAENCGRFVATSAIYCNTHTDPAPGEELDWVLRSLAHVLGRLMREEDDLAILSKDVPRVSSVAIQAARAHHQIGEKVSSAMISVLMSTAEEMEEDLLNSPDSR